MYYYNKFVENFLNFSYIAQSWLCALNFLKNYNYKVKHKDEGENIKSLKMFFDIQFYNHDIVTIRWIPTYSKHRVWYLAYYF